MDWIHIDICNATPHLHPFHDHLCRRLSRCRELFDTRLALAWCFAVALVTTFCLDLETFLNSLCRGSPMACSAACMCSRAAWASMAGAGWLVVRKALAFCRVACQRVTSRLSCIWRSFASFCKDLANCWDAEVVVNVVWGFVVVVVRRLLLEASPSSDKSRPWAKHLSKPLFDDAGIVDEFLMDALTCLLSDFRSVGKGKTLKRVGWIEEASCQTNRRSMRDHAKR